MSQPRIGSIRKKAESVSVSAEIFTLSLRARLRAQHEAMEEFVRQKMAIGDYETAARSFVKVSAF
jgi:hypothetical protein